MNHGALRPPVHLYLLTFAENATELIVNTGDTLTLSRPTRARGLKPQRYDQSISLRPSRPTRGAWIETRADSELSP